MNEKPISKHDGAKVTALSAFIGIVVDLIALDLSPLGFLSAIEENRQKTGPRHNEAKSNGFGNA